jgi:hypothetical protein
MPRITARIEVPEKHKALKVAIDTEADPALIARGLADKLELPAGRYVLRLKDSFEMRDGITLELVAESIAPFDIIGDAD